MLSVSQNCTGTWVTLTFKGHYRYIYAAHEGLVEMINTMIQVVHIKTRRLFYGRIRLRKVIF